MKNSNIKILCEGAIMVALAQILGYIKLFRMPQGGSVTLAMLPIFIYAYRRGLKNGLLAGLALGLLQCTLDNSWNWGWQSVLLDYIVAYTLTGVAGAFNSVKGGLYVGATVGALLRCLSHVISGYLYVQEYTDLEVLGVKTASPWIYSIIYNGSYLLLSLIACLVVLFILDKRKVLTKYL